MTGNAGKPAGNNAAEEDIDDLTPGGEDNDEAIINGDVPDDAEKDAAAARAAKEAGADNKDEEDPQAAMVEAMRAAADPDKHTEQVMRPGKDKAPAKKDDAAAAEAAKTPEQKAADEKAAADKIAEEKAAAEKAGKTPEQLKAEEEAAVAERKKTVDAEADKLGLKGKSRERFHEMSERIEASAITIANQDKQLRSLATDLMKLQVGPEAKFDDVVKGITQSVAQSRQFEDAIFASGLEAADFQTAGVIKRCMESADPMLLQHARGHLVKMMETIDTKLGHKVEGGDDALLAMFPDLAEKVQKGAIDKVDALELAKARNQDKAIAAARQNEGKQTAEQLAVQQGGQACVDYATKAASANPARWQALWPETSRLLGEIRQKYPPSLWADQFELQYNRLPWTPPARQPDPKNNGAGNGERAPRPGQPRRTGSGRPAGSHTADVVAAPPEDETPFEAMQRAMREAAGT